MRIDPTVGRLEEEVRQQSTAETALQNAIRVTGTARTATENDLAQVRGRISARTAAALPGDQGIQARLDSAIQSAFSAATQVLDGHWDEIVTMLREALEKVGAELAGKRRELRDAEVRVERERGEQTAAAR